MLCCTESNMRARSSAYANLKTVSKANLKVVSILFQNCMSSLFCCAGERADAVLQRKQHEGAILCLRAAGAGEPLQP